MGIMPIMARVAFKVGDEVEFDAKVTRVAPTDDGALVVSVQPHGWPERVTVREDFVRRGPDADTPVIAEGEEVMLTGRVTRVAPGYQDKLNVSFRVDGSSTIITTNDDGARRTGRKR